MGSHLPFVPSALGQPRGPRGAFEQTGRWTRAQLGQRECSPRTDKPLDHKCHPRRVLSSGGAARFGQRRAPETSSWRPGPGGQTVEARAAGKFPAAAGVLWGGGCPGHPVLPARTFATSCPPASSAALMRLFWGGRGPLLGAPQLCGSQGLCDSSTHQQVDLQLFLAFWGSRQCRGPAGSSQRLSPGPGPGVPASWRSQHNTAPLCGGLLGGPSPIPLGPCPAALLCVDILETAVHLCAKTTQEDKGLAKLPGLALNPRYSGLSLLRLWDHRWQPWEPETNPVGSLIFPSSSCVLHLQLRDWKVSETHFPFQEEAGRGSPPWTTQWLDSWSARGQAEVRDKDGNHLTRRPDPRMKDVPEKPPHLGPRKSGASSTPGEASMGS
ncbi:uncharacterized protein [Marmota flaviventris]|uniref:uncharacterized protein n=1 Tax=Marmota flaviventris TaxID=93162 RepID=UPI003A8A4C92